MRRDVFFFFLQLLFNDSLSHFLERVDSVLTTPVAYQINSLYFGESAVLPMLIVVVVGHVNRLEPLMIVGGVPGQGRHTHSPLSFHTSFVLLKSPHP